MPDTPANVAELLARMIAFDSVNSEVSGLADPERPLAEWLAELGAQWGMTAKWLPVEGHAPNLLLTCESDATAPWIVFDSHLDTVGVAGMTIDPFAGEVRDERVYGRGACDTKGSGAAMLWAAREAVADDALRANVAILFSVGEEHYQVGARAFLEHHLPELGWRPAAMIVGEPTALNTVAASNGFLRCRVVTRGRAAHSSTPQRGHNAISDMAHAIVAIEDEHIAKIDAVHPLTGRGTCSINQVQGGQQHNIVPDGCWAQIDQRLAPGQTAEKELGSIRAAIESVESDPAFPITLEQVESAAAYDSPACNELAQRVTQTLRDAGMASEACGAPYTTNANHYAAAGLASVVLGPGDIAQAHTADEWIALEELRRGVKAYEAILRANVS